MTRAAWSRVVGCGLIGLAAGSVGFVWDRSAAGLAVGLGIAAGLMVEAVWLAAGLTKALRAGPICPVGARPADGEVHVWTMAGVATADPIAATPWKRWRGIHAGATPSLLDWAGNRPLLGRIALISVFVGRNGRSWTDPEIRAAHESLSSVGRWIEREAIRWAAPVNIGLADTFFQLDDTDPGAVEIEFVPEGDDFGPLEAHATTRSVAGASRGAAALGFRDIADLMGRINPLVAADAHVWLWHLKERGRSHAVPVGDRVVAGVGLAICFARESSFRELLTGPARVDPVTVAHELMHLFGALDKYGVALDRFAADQVSHRDIMRLDESRLDRLRVGRLTAREIGWLVRNEKTRTRSVSGGGFVDERDG